MENQQEFFIKNRGDCMKAYCTECNQEQDYSILERNEKLFGYKILIVNCNVCNERLYIDEIVDANVKSFSNYMDSLEKVQKTKISYGELKLFKANGIEFQYAKLKEEY